MQTSRPLWSYVLCVFSFLSPTWAAETFPPAAPGAAALTDCETALRTWRNWAQQGDAGAQLFVAALYGGGLGVSRDDEESVRWLRKAAEQGLAQAQYDLSVAYMTGRGVAKNDAEVALWTRKAAEQGFAPAQHNLGSQYVNGSRGVTKDQPEGIRWFRKAAEQGWVPSQRSLIAVYWQGRDAPKDLIEAYKWATLAMEGTQEGPERLQTARGRDEIAKSMNPGEIEQASKLARDWNQAGTVIYSDPRFARLGALSRVTPGRTIEAVTYTVSAPAAEGWDVQVDSYNDTVTFHGGSPVTKEAGLITVARLEIGFAGGVQDPVELVAAIQCTSEANFRKRAKIELDRPGAVSKQTETIGGKTVYSTHYAVTDRRLGPAVDSTEAMYIYLPPNWKESKRAYLFGVAQAQKIGDVVLLTHVSEVTAVISSFREK